MKLLTLISLLAATAYAAPAELEAFVDPIANSKVNGEKILPRLASSP
jgi:hypothetical protein